MPSWLAHEPLPTSDDQAMTSSPPKRIGIAIVEHDGRYLVGTRGPESPLPGYAEFPGGKCEPGETAEACAVRETREETGLAVEVGRLMLRREYTYPHATVDLHFFLCHPVNLLSLRDDHQGFRWIAARELQALKFPEANEPIVEMLSSR
ncbi:MAG: nudG [Schlesneria sp.]|nr:nudG [Schlesneria sp.]